ncbi:MAG: hypothetical protein ACRDCW_11655, partial [Sarcina sp.]
MKFIICDDELIQRDILKKYIKEIMSDGKYQILEFSSGEELLNNYPIDTTIIFLDIKVNIRVWEGMHSTDKHSARK